MAKSLRSKFKRKMRSLKRKKLVARQLKKLEEKISAMDASAMEVVEESAKVPEADEEMKNEKSSGVNLKTMKKPDGRYPIWLSQRKIRKLKRKSRLMKKLNIKK